MSPDTCHWLAEQAPDDEEMLAALTEFLAPYRECTAATPSPKAVPPWACRRSKRAS